MDWKKYFGHSGKEDQDKHNFKKFDYEDEEDDFDLDSFFNNFQSDNLTGFPPSILRQFKEILEAMDGLHRDGDDESRQRFAEKYSEFKLRKDSDLDDKIYSDQLDSLLKRFSPDLMLKDEPKKEETVQKATKKLTDDEKIMDKIHGTFLEEVRPAPQRPRKSQVHKAPMAPHHFGALPPFHEYPPPSSPSHAKTWGKTVISIRKSDGSTEKSIIERTAEGNVKTTVTKTDAEGHSSTRTFMGDEKSQVIGGEQKMISSESQSRSHEERNMIEYNGYKIPCLF